MSTLARAIQALRITTAAAMGLAIGALVGVLAGAIFGFRVGVVISTEKHDPGCFTGYKPAQLSTGEPVLVPLEICSKEPGTKT